MIKKLLSKIKNHKIATAFAFVAIIALMFLIRFVLDFAPFLFLKSVTDKDLDALSLDGYDKVMIVAHPDDETFWGSSALQKDKYLVVCITRGYDSTRRAELERVASETDDKVLMLSYPDKIGAKRSDWKLWRKDIEADVRTVLAYKSWSTVVTHNKDGEYGHTHHIMTHNFVTDAYNSLGMTCDLYNFAKYYTKEEAIPDGTPLLSDEVYKKKLRLVDEYESQSYAREKFEHMFRDEAWIKVK